MNALRFALLAHDYVADNSVADQGQAPSSRGGWKRHARTVEVRRGVATALAFVAVMASRPPAMHGGEIGHTVGHHDPAKLFADDFPRQLAAAGEAHGRQEFAVGHLLEAFARAAYSDEGFHQVVIRSQVLVT